MSIPQQEIQSISKTLSEGLKVPNPAELVSSVGSVVQTIKDPVGPAVVASLTAINKLSDSISSRIDKMQEDIVKSLDNTGKVKIVDNRIVITVEPEDVQKAEKYQQRITSQITSIQSNINRLNTLVKTLNTLNSTARTLKRVMDVQEALLMSNPISAATFKTLKKGIGILFTKDILSEYIKLLSTELVKSNNIVSQLTNKFSNLTVELSIKQANNNGDITANKESEEKRIVDENVTKFGNNQNELFTNFEGKTFNLTVEKYGERQIIGIARDSFTKLTIAQTAPSFISTPEQLIEELKEILNQ